MKHSCPICKKPTDSESDADFPFCSERCRLLDLGNWSAEKYVISRPAFDEEMLEELLNDKPRTNPTNMNPKTDAGQPKPQLALAIATGFGLGYLPKAPGTFGSLLGVLRGSLGICILNMTHGSAHQCRLLLRIPIHSSDSLVAGDVTS